MYYRTLLPCMILSKTTMMAITSKIWTNPPALYPTKPISHPITKITAII